MSLGMLSLGGFDFGLLDPIPTLEINVTARHSSQAGRPDRTGQRDPDALIRRATERPGIREVIRVYEDWKRVDRGMDPYRAATTWVDRATSVTGT